MRKVYKGWVEYYARLIFLLCGLILATAGINAMIRIMPEHKIVFIILAFIFVISWTITGWIDLRRIRKRAIKGE